MPVELQRGPGHTLPSGPSTTPATASALARPGRRAPGSRASRIVPSPWVRQCVGTSRGRRRTGRCRARVAGSRVLMRVREANDEVGSLKPMCPFAPMPRICRSIRPRRRSVLVSRRPPRVVGAPVGHVDSPGPGRAAPRRRGRGPRGSSRGARREADVLVERERRDPRAVEPLAGDRAGQLGVDGRRGRPGGEAEHGVGLAPDQGPILAPASRPTSAGVEDDDDLHTLPRGRP